MPGSGTAGIVAGPSSLSDYGYKRNFSEGLPKIKARFPHLNDLDAFKIYFAEVP